MPSSLFNSSRRVATFGLLAGLAVVLPACKKADEKAAKPATGAAYKTDEQKVSYGVGFQMGTEVSNQTLIDRDALLAGINDGLAKNKAKIPEAELQQAFQAVQQKLVQANADNARKNLTAGNEFLEKNKSRPGVKTTASGLQYEVLKSGSGPKAAKTSTVVVAYHGTLIDGTVFDSSVERGDTAEFPVTGVIPGWTEALQLMSVGDKWKLYIPANLAYGERARGKIPPNAALVFEVELKQIK